MVLVKENRESEKKKNRVKQTGINKKKLKKKWNLGYSWVSDLREVLGLGVAI